MAEWQYDVEGTEDMGIELELVKLGATIVMSLVLLRLIPLMRDQNRTIQEQNAARLVQSEAENEIQKQLVEILRQQTETARDRNAETKQSNDRLAQVLEAIASRLQNIERVTTERADGDGLETLKQMIENKFTIISDGITTLVECYQQDQTDAAKSQKSIRRK